MKVVLTLLSCLVFVGGANAQGILTGRVTDSAGAVLPGVDVVAEKDGSRARTVTDNRGQYEFKGLGEGKYTVTAALAGFASSAPERVAIIEGGGNASVDLVMCMKGLPEILIVIPQTLDDLWASAAVVVHVRITGVSPEPSLPCPGESFTQVAELLEVFKSPSPMPPGKTLTFHKAIWMEERAPYRDGEELVLFLSGTPRGLLRDGASADAFRLQGNRVVNRYAPNVTDGATAVEFLEKLRSKARGPKVLAAWPCHVISPWATCWSGEAPRN